MTQDTQNLAYNIHWRILTDDVVAFGYNHHRGPLDYTRLHNCTDPISLQTLKGRCQEHELIYGSVWNIHVTKRQNWDLMLIKVLFI